MKEVKKLRFGLGFQVETDKGPVDLYSVNAEEDVSGTYVQYKDYDELLRERNELAAQVERLRGASESVIGPRPTDGQYLVLIDNLKAALSEPPAQSLEAVKREWKEGLEDYLCTVSYQPYDGAEAQAVDIQDILRFEP